MSELLTDGASTETQSKSDFYGILGLSRDATLEAIKQAYRKLSLFYHPDKKTGDAVKYAQINMAYKVLSNDRRKAKYDASLASTFNELVSAERDTSYHRAPEWMTVDQTTGKASFDRDRFLTEFNAQNQSTPVSEPVDSRPIEEVEMMRLMEQRLAERDALAREIVENVESTSAKLRACGSSFNDRFNNVFDDLQRRNRELISSPMSDPVAHEHTEDNVFDGVVTGFHTANLNIETGACAGKIHEKSGSTWDAKLSEVDAQSRMKAYQQTTDALAELKEFSVSVNEDLLSAQEIDTI